MLVCGSYPAPQSLVPGMDLLPQQGWAQGFKMRKTHKAAASW